MMSPKITTSGHPFSYSKASILLALVVLFTSCRQVDLYEKNTSIPKQQWKSDFLASGSVIIKDTVSNYNIYVVLRHADSYKYNNIWLNIGLQAPGDTMNFTKVNLILGNDAQGWAGSGMDDIWEVRKMIAPGTPLRKAGTYNFTIAQVMRDNPLNGILSAGLRVEKLNQ